MKTDDLINALAAKLEPVPQGWATRRLVAGPALGMAVSLLIVWGKMGLRPDMMAATATPMFWVKFAYTLALGLIAGVTMSRLARPGRTVGQAVMIAGGAAVAVLFVAAAVKLTGAGPDERHALLMGGSARVCARNIVVLSLPVYAGAIWGLRRLAPTRPTLTGLVAGLASGGLGAFIYALHCTESASPFVALWYTLGIGVTGALGAVIGRFALRW